MQKKLSSILTNEVCPPVITAASPVTSDPNVHSFWLRSRRFRGSYQQELHQALYLLRHFRLNDISNSLFLPTKWQIREEQIKALQEKAAEGH
jgi:hypothetical protein